MKLENEHILMHGKAWISKRALVTRNLKITIMLCVAFALAFSIALQVVVKQRKTIAGLRSELDRQPVNESRPAPEPVQEPAVQAELPTVSDASPINLSETETNALLSPAAIPLASTAMEQVLRENEKLQAQLEELEAQLAHARRLVPEPEDARAAYVGPGTWVNADGQTRGTTKVVISRQASGESSVSGLSIEAWGRCLPSDCEWGEVPFFLLNWNNSEPFYRRGFAAWQFPSGNRKYLIISFEKTGLTVDCVTLPANQSPSPSRRVERMTRIN